jgi:hypothetical protein
MVGEKLKLNGWGKRTLTLWVTDRGIMRHKNTPIQDHHGEMWLGLVWHGQQVRHQQLPLSAPCQRRTSLDLLGPD